MVYREIFRPTNIDRPIPINKFLFMIRFLLIIGIKEINTSPIKIIDIPIIAVNDTDSFKKIIPQNGIKKTALPLARGYTIDKSANLYALPKKA